MLIDRVSISDSPNEFPESQTSFFPQLQCTSVTTARSKSSVILKLSDAEAISPKSLKPSVRSPKFTPANWWRSLLWGAASALLAVMPVQAAEQIVFAYGQLEFYLPISSLENFAKNGTVDRDLEFYFRFLSKEDLGVARKVLNASTQEKPLPVSQILYSFIGEASLRSIGELIQTGYNQNGFYAIRAASIRAAADPEGLSLIGFLRHFPTPNIRINLPLILNVVDRVSKGIDTSNKVVQTIQSRSQAAAAAEGLIDFKNLPPLPEKGPYPFEKQTLMLQDSRRDRPIPTDLYVPNFQGNIPASIPVAVWSHGLGETRESYLPFQEHLAANGFVVISPEHIGSDKDQQERLLKGKARDISRVSEYYDRPQDVSFVLDILEQKNQAEFGGRLNLKNVGAYGHSFGGYTVLVIGGATVDFKRLRQECEKDFLLRLLDVSLLLECQALELESSPKAVELLTSGQLRDPRVKFVMAISPVTTILSRAGLSQIQLPVVLFGGGADPIAPLILEQLGTFTALTTPDKYLLVSNDASHTVQITELIDRFILPKYTKAELDENVDILLKNVRGLGLAFMQVYVAGRSEYRPYLTASYVQSLEIPPANFSLLRSFPSELLSQLLGKELSKP
ncbi:MAG: dienelactone hydrolase [Pseudanabaena sp.]|nr:MAG: dienelactone hydrolase [Pseudanabaena sp.]